MTQILPQEWFTADEISRLKLPGLPETESGIIRRAKTDKWNLPAKAWHPEHNPLGVWRRREKVQGGPTEYHYSVLPIMAQKQLARRAKAAEAPGATRAQRKARIDRDAAWEHFDRLPDSRKNKARAKLRVLDAVRALVLAGTAKEVAVSLVCAEHGVSTSSYYNWEGRIAGLSLGDRLPHLVDHHAGRTKTAPMSEPAWEAYKADYLRNEKRSHAESYALVEDLAKTHGWSPIPSKKTFQRRLEREIPAEVIVFAREGEKGLETILAPNRRDRTHYHSMEAVNYDGHKIDLFVEWPDEKTGRVFLLAFQDLRSNKIVGWRLDRAETAEGFRLAAWTMISRYGLPDHIFSDNTMAAAAKQNTGGSRYRRRFKIKPEDPVGVFTAVGCEVHFTRPAHGQSKPIERAFGELSRTIAKAPECAGAWTGNSPENKPANYGSKAVPFETLVKVVEREIARFNARPDRNASVAKGRSFDAVFEENYVNAPVRRVSTLTPEQQRMFLLAVEDVTCRQPDGRVELHENIYWHEALIGYRGKQVAVRYDPDDLTAPAHVYRLDGSFICSAELHEAGRFDSREAAADRGRQEKVFKRKVKEIAAQAKELGIEDIAAMMPDGVSEPLLDAGVIKMGKGPKRAADADVPKPEPGDRVVFNFEDFAAGVALAKASQG
ncbi:transposase domain-containing protein [Rhodospirillum sp. A1_3_36]|uniref:transposase domain-containing protein n=1 Tax=Rhodospirillum sp. A1_3_36 TaxID=3391666 RepID=UPI0039A6D2DF